MYVIKRDGRRAPVQFDKITARITKLAYQLDGMVDPVAVAQKTAAGVYSGVQTSDLDKLAAETAAHMALVHPDYAVLAGRLEVSNLHKNTTKTFSAVVESLYQYEDTKAQRRVSSISEAAYLFIQANKDLLDSCIVYDRDFRLDFFGFKTLEKSYLLRINGRIVERPQHLYMRVACQLNLGDAERAVETYNYLSEGYFVHATPTLFNSATPHPQLASCFLMTMKEDSIKGIYDTVSQCAQVSKYAGGIGLSISSIRSTGSFIAGTNGYSNGIIPMCRVFNATARYVDQGGGKRRGSIAMYLEPHHPNIMEFLDLRKNNGAEELRCRDLFLGLWISDLFMERVEADGQWSLFCPHECPGLQDVYGELYKKLYREYEEAGRAKQTLRARQVWQAILTSQVETGTPYMMFKNACNSKSNQQHLGTIRSSNLCTEIVEYTSPDEVAVCNLASIALPRFVDEKKGDFDFKKLEEVVAHVVINLNRVIDLNFYPIPEAKRSNLRHRPIGIGIQGLATTFFKLRLPYESKPAQQLNKRILETMYHAAVQASVELAKRDGPYETFACSPSSQGKLQFDLWDHVPESGRYDWDQLKAEVKEHGMRNSQLLCMMPTASTSQMLGNTPSWEPQMSNMFTRRTLSGDFVVSNRYLVSDLLRLGLWNEDMKHEIMRHHGSIQKIQNIPQELKDLYKTAYEISGKTQILMSRDRGRYICQSESFNAFMTDTSKLTSRHFYAWKTGLKTGMYYLRTVAASDPTQFTVPVKKRQKVSEVDPESLLDTPVDPLASAECAIDCLSCGS